MEYISATETKQRLAAVLDAAQANPVTIRRRNRDVAVVMSAKEYQRLRGSNTEELQRFCDAIGNEAAKRGLTEDKLNTLLAADD